MLALAIRGPAENARRLVGAGTRVIGIQADNPILVEFGLEIDTKMIVIPARILQPPTLLYGGNKKIVPRDASWNLAGVCGLGKEAPFPADGYRTNLGEGDDDVTDKALLKVLRQAKSDGVKFLFVILKSHSKAIHSRLKYFGDIIVWIPHTTLISDNFVKQCRRNDLGANYFANIMQKVNVKIGGINHVLSPEGDPLEFLTNICTMLVGIDVSHPAATSVANAPSVVGVVASLDRTYTRSLGTTRLQEGRVEMVAEIGALIDEGLESFKTTNQRYPSNIIIYRDGVSESQFETVLNEEVPAIEEVCSEKYPGDKQNPPKIVVIICGKRHHTRLCPTQEQDADKAHNCNPKPGTLADRGVTSGKYYDFYIQPHAALTGTAIPCHCTVIRDDIKIGPDVLQKITHNLSYLYSRATKAVSLCTPAYYADIMCERGNK
ncbi:MAG: hypothetical protein L6R40_008558 [Gallowayella cf. fulva]|nr:MAG: hypothetical protein L6R40_008558 [Xanthomendoza cf. fulva]